MNMQILAQFEPKTINDFIYSSNESRETIADIVSGAVPFPYAGKNGILLYGVWGTGKTALAKILPQAIEDNRTETTAWDRFETIKPGNNGADLMSIIDKQTNLWPQSTHHYIVLDEVDLLTETAMSSLKSIMGKPRTIFIMTTNNLDRIDRGVINRSVLVDFNAAHETDWLVRVRQVLAAGDVIVEDDEILLDIIRPCEGSARGILNATQSFIRKRKAIASAPAYII